MLHTLAHHSERGGAAEIQKRELVNNIAISTIAIITDVLYFAKRIVDCSENILARSKSNIQCRNFKQACEKIRGHCHGRVVVKIANRL